jgi:hypothetical protein
MIHIFKFLFVFTVILISFSSCKKGCEYPSEDTLTGDIIKDAYILGLNTGGVKSVHYVLDSNNVIEVSFDQGYTYIPVDFSKYTVMNFPVTVGCNTHFEKDVTIDHASSKVTFTLGVNSCPDCEEQYRQDNWVLVSKFPNNYFVEYKRK